MEGPQQPWSPLLQTPSFLRIVFCHARPVRKHSVRVDVASTLVLELIDTLIVQR